MLSNSQINSPANAFILSAAIMGTFFFWQASTLTSAYYNSGFAIMYFVCFLLICSLLLSEQATSLLSRSLLASSLKHACRSQRFHFVSMLSMFAGFILLVTALSHLSSITESFAYTSTWYTSNSPQKALNALVNQQIYLKIIIAAIIIVIVFFIQSQSIFLKICRAFALLAFISLAALGVLFGLSNKAPLLTFLTPDLSLFTQLDAWIYAFTLAVLSTFVGFGINSVFGKLMQQQTSLRKFTYLFAIVNFLSLVVILAIYHSFLNTDASHSTQSLSMSNAYLLNLLMYGCFALGLLITIVLLCQTFKTTQGIKHKKIVYAPLFIVLLAFTIIYQLVMPNSVKLLVTQEWLISVILVICYVETLVFAWIFDAQKLSYELYKTTKLKLSIIFNISVRLITPNIVLSIFLLKAIESFTTISWLSAIIVFLICVLLTITLGSLLYKKFK